MLSDNEILDLAKTQEKVDCVTCSGLSVAQQKKAICVDEVKYENHNQADPDPLTVRDLTGQVTDMRSAPIPQACLSIYTESEHKLITSTTSDEDGNYKFDVSMLNSSPRTRASE